MIKPFSANISEEILDDLKNRIKNTRWPDEISDSNWMYGTNLSFMKELSNYWLYKFDWRKVEAEINYFPNFIANIDGYDIHFIHVKGKGKKNIPLIITHGWPGSFIEMLKLIPLLTNEAEISFDLVIPSITGFGYSGKSLVEGCNSEFVAHLWHKLMLELGYERYGAQGGDIGSGVSSWLALKYPLNLIGLHLNYISGSYTPFLEDGEQLTDKVVAFQKYASDWASKEAAYSYIQSTKPITIAFALNDSPIGLCAWIIEKFNSWSDNNGEIYSVFTKDELLANVTLYWITQTIHSSIRMYNENSKHPLKFDENDFINVPVGFAKFPKELPTPPRSYIEKGFNITHWTEMPVGGHFAGMEQPDLLAKDIKVFFQEIAIFRKKY
ncbi:epoxide hydrolase family protein [Leeuwenhoekiella sp. NPDC079379]|uniref:epoxide hydrolase family protein n=1 Tax=Leeuwenhoekiella sp. NPDC079379 TaxID=3364122 RepID=UPI0037C61B96